MVFRKRCMSSQRDEKRAHSALGSQRGSITVWKAAVISFVSRVSNFRLFSWINSGRACFSTIFFILIVLFDGITVTVPIILVERNCCCASNFVCGWTIADLLARTPF